MILVDTSVWVERDRATGGPADRALQDLLESDAIVCTTDPVEMELMAAAPDRVAARRLVVGVDSIAFEPETDFPAAARIYANCRAAGSTPRGLIDCMIAAVAIRASVPLLAQDRDFAAMAAVTDLELAKV